MNDMTGCPYIRQSLGVYVLGAIDPAGRAQVDAHLAGCAECREELAGLAGLPALLGRVPFDEAARIAGPEDSYSERLRDEPPVGPRAGAAGPGDVIDLAPLLGRISRHRRVSRLRGVIAAAAVALIAAGAAIGVTDMTSGGGRPAVAGAQGAQGTQHWQTVRGTDPGTLARVVVRYAGMPWGTRLETEVYGIPAGTGCQFWVLGSGGHRWLAGSWRVASTYRETWYQASSWVPSGAVHGFEITSGDKVLVHITAT